MNPIKAPKVFNIISSISANLYVALYIREPNNWSNSIDNDIIEDIFKTFMVLEILLQIQGNKNPNGINRTMLPTIWIDKIPVNLIMSIIDLVGTIFIMGIFDEVNLRPSIDILSIGIGRNTLSITIIIYIYNARKIIWYFNDLFF